jgi:hypothetical protein
MLLENMDEMKVENDMGSVTEGDYILKKTDEGDMPTFSGQKIKPEVHLLTDEVVGGCTCCLYVYECVFFCRQFAISFSFLTILTIILFE